MKEDSLLVERAKNGDRRAFKDLYDLHAEPLYRFMRQYSAQTVEVEDWVQRAFIKAYHHLDTFAGASRFATWLFTIALNEMRTDRRRPSLVAFDSEELKDVDGESRDSDDFIWDDALRTLVDKMEETKKTVFLLYEVEGYSHAEIASMLGVGESASRTILHRARRWLKQEWQSEERDS